MSCFTDCINIISFFPSPCAGLPPGHSTTGFLQPGNIFVCYIPDGFSAFRYKQFLLTYNICRPGIGYDFRLISNTTVLP